MRALALVEGGGGNSEGIHCSRGVISSRSVGLVFRYLGGLETWLLGFLLDACNFQLLVTAVFVGRDASATCTPYGVQHTYYYIRLRA